MYYWVDKYTLLRKSTLRGEVSGKFVLTGMKLLDLTLLLRPAGELIFDIQLRHKTGLASSIVMVCIGFIYFVSFHLREFQFEQMESYHKNHGGLSDKPNFHLQVSSSRDWIRKFIPPISR